MRYAVLVTGLLASGGCDVAGSDCSFDAYLERYLDDSGERAELVDCGDLPVPTYGVPPDANLYRAARECVLDAIAARRPYIARWEVQGIEGSDEIALVWLGGDDRPSRISRGVTAEARLAPPVRVECDQVMDLGDCPNVVTSLCLSCQGPIVDRCGE